MSEGQWGRLERNELDAAGPRPAVLAGRALGLQGSFRYFPAGEPVRDTAQLEPSTRFRRRCGRLFECVVKCILPGGDLRAWDGMVHGDGASVLSPEVSRMLGTSGLERRMRT